MLTANIHVCFVSAQSAPNLLPALDPSLKPSEVILLVSDKMKARADALTSVFQEVGVKVTRVDLPKDSEHDFKQLEEHLMELASQRSSDRLALNVTGGTKLMALAAHSIVANEANWEVFYVDVDTDEIILLGKGNQRRKLGNTLRLPHYLRAYGYQPELGSNRQPVSKECVDLMKDLILNIGSLESPLSQLNWLAQEATADRGFEVLLSDDQQDSRSLENLLRKFQEAGVLSVKGERLRFCNEACRSFANGGWLEDFVSRTVGRVKEVLCVRDQSTNLVVSGAAGDKYELDVAFMARNRLHVIECKTARMDGPRASKANDTLFKLAEISRNVGGLGTRAMLASYRALSEHERHLANALGIKLVCGADLRVLDEKLRSWI